MIRLENVTKSYSTEVVALRDASFDVAKAEFERCRDLAQSVGLRLMDDDCRNALAQLGVPNPLPPPGSDEDGGEADSAVPAGDVLDASTPFDASAQEDADAQ